MSASLSPTPVGNPETLAILAARRGEGTTFNAASPTNGVGSKGGDPNGTQGFVDRMKAREEARENEHRVQQRRREKQQDDQRRAQERREQSSRKAMALGAASEHPAPASPAATASPATAEEADGYLKSLMADNRYWTPNPLRDAIHDGVQALFQVAYPGAGQTDATGRAILPDHAAVSLEALESEATRRLPPDFVPTSFLPRQPEPPPREGGFIDTRRYPNWVRGALLRAWYDAQIRPHLTGDTLPDTVMSFRPDPARPLQDQIQWLQPDPKTHQITPEGISPPTLRDTPESGRRDNADIMELGREDWDKPIAPPKPHRIGDTSHHVMPLTDEAQGAAENSEHRAGIGHNDGPAWADDTFAEGHGDDTLTGGSGGDDLGPDTSSESPPANPWVRQDGETIEEFRFRIAKELESKSPDPAKLEELEAALLDGIAQEPNAFLLMQGTTPDRLSGMEPEPDPSIAQGVLDAAAANGGIPPTGTGASIAHVIGPDGTVYRRGADGADRASLGLIGTLNEIRGQHIAATGKKHADAGDTAALINHAMDHGALDMAPVALGIGAAGAVRGMLGGNRGRTFGPADRSGGGSGKKAADHGKNERHGDGGALEQIQPRIRELKTALKEATTRKDKSKIRQRIENITKTAEKKRRGTEHSRKAKR